MNLIRFIKKKSFPIIIVMLGALGIIGAYFIIMARPHNNLHNTFTIVATTSILADTIKNIVQDKAEVTALMGPGVDPHTCKVRHNDLQALQNADMIFYHGLFLEEKMAELLDKLKTTKHAYAVGDAINKEHFIIDSHFSAGIDPHIWFDITLWKQVVQYISMQLQQQNTSLSSFYQKNTHDYLEQLDLLHTMNKEMIQQIAILQRVLITTHDAFGYFGRAYNIQTIGLQGISTAAECGLRDIKHLVDIIVKKKIKAIFLETCLPDKSIRAVIEGCKEQGHFVIIGGILYSDSLGSPDTPEGTYQGIIIKNIHTIVNALK